MPSLFERRLTGPIARPLSWLLLAWLPLGCAADNTAGSRAEDNASNRAAASAAAQEQAAEGNGEKPYDVDCQTDESGARTCLVDRGTYVGWRTFHANCHVCHGQNAVGSSFAPSLLKPIDKERFVNVVTEGYTGQVGVMPAWGENPNVKDFIDELYAYQQARADGVLLPGRPKRKD